MQISLPESKLVNEPGDNPGVIAPPPLIALATVLLDEVIE
jgi:hypothetical protein